MSLSNSIDINFQNDHGHTPAMIAVIHNHQTSINTPKLVQLLLDHGADADIKDDVRLYIFSTVCINSCQWIIGSNESV